MDSMQALRTAVREQAEQLRRMEKAVDALEKTDTAEENRRLSELSRRQAAELDEARGRADTLDRELAEARWQLREQMRAEREDALRASRERAMHYFGAANDGRGDRLTWLEGACRERARALRARLDGLADERAAPIAERLDALEAAADAGFAEQREIARREWAQRQALAGAEYDAVGNTPMPPPRAAKPLRAEMMIGQRVLQIVGLVILLLGVVFGLQYTYANLLTSNVAKGVAAYALGLIFLGAGEWMSWRRGRNPFALGLSAGGVAILYIATAVSYFTLGILPIPAALALCAGVTALAFLLSIRRDTQLIAIFALVGGHLPLVAVDSDILLYAALGYLLALNVFALLIAARRQWRVMRFMAFGLYAVSTLTTLVILPDAYDFPVFRAVRVAYLALTFLLFMAMVLVRPVRLGTPLLRSDVALLSMNTIYHGAFMFAVFSADAPDFAGLVAILYAAVFFALARLAKRFYAADPSCPVLFCAASYVFVALFPPMQFGAAWFSLIWLAEGCALAVFGIATERRWYERAGLLLLIAGGAASLLSPLNLLRESAFIWRFSATVAALLTATAAYLGKCGFRPDGLPGPRRRLTLGMLYAAIPALWVYLVYLCGYVADHADLSGLYVLRDMPWYTLAACVTLPYGFALRYLPRLRTKTVRAFADGAVIAAFLMAVAANTVGYSTRWEALVILGPVNLALLAAVFLCARDHVRDRGMAEPMQVILPTCAMLALFTIAAMVQLALPFGAMELSFFYLAVALGWVVLGFLRRYRSVRLMGLVLSLMSVAKLFLLDMAHLGSWQRIVSYFVFGGMLIGISYVYTYFARRIDREDDARRRDTPG